MSAIEISQIIIPDNRQRREFKPASIEELAESIKSKGLMHPIVLRLHTEEDTDPETPPQTGYILVAGERRLRAMQHLGWTYAPYTLLEDLTDYEYREAELEENVLRVDLTWQEKSDAYAELHKLRLERNPRQSFSETAREIKGIAPGGDLPGRTDLEVSRSMIVSQFKDDPEVSRAKTLKEAAKIAERKIRLEFTAALAKAQSEKQVKREGPQHRLFLGKCEHVMRDFGPEFSCVIADPPYGMGADKFGDAAQGIHSYQDDLGYAQEIMAYILQGGFTRTKEQAHLYMFCDIDQFDWIRRVAANMGWKPWRTPLIWPKGGSGHIPWGPGFWRRGYECVFFATKGDKPLARLNSDVLSNMPAPQERDYAAEKPVELYKLFIALSCLPGDQVLDPCCGSGTIFPAAQACGVIATGIEPSEDAYKIAQGRLMEAQGHG